MPLHFLLKMMRWLRHPPPRHMRLLIAVVFCIGASLALIEYFFGWPDALTVDPRMRTIGRPPQPQPIPGS
jgi:hypothetical protein